jgi:threonine/homoserine efflux transporter RhtA
VAVSAGGASADQRYGHHPHLDSQWVNSDGSVVELGDLIGYLFNNFGIRAIGTASTAVIGSSGPAVTAILSLAILGDLLTGGQWSAILLVTFGVLLMNLARLQSPHKKQA